MTERDSGRPRLNEKYEAIRRAARDAEQAVQKDKEEKRGRDSWTVIRAWEAKKKNGEWRTEDSIELLIDMLYADGEVHEKLVNKLLVLAKNTQLGHMEFRRIQAALQYAVDQGRYKDLRRMYFKRRRHLDTDAGGGLDSQ